MPPAVGFTEKRKDLTQKKRWFAVPPVSYHLTDGNSHLITNFQHSATLCKEHCSSSFCVGCAFVECDTGPRWLTRWDKESKVGQDFTFKKDQQIGA